MYNDISNIILLAPALGSETEGLRLLDAWHPAATNLTRRKARADCCEDHDREIPLLWHKFAVEKGFEINGRVRDMHHLVPRRIEARAMSSGLPGLDWLLGTTHMIPTDSGSVERQGDTRLHNRPKQRQTSGATASVSCSAGSRVWEGSSCQPCPRSTHRHP